MKLRSLWNCFKPVKGFGTVGMYQRMIVLCNWLILINVTVTLVVNGFSFDSRWILMVSNYAIGVACSSFLVLATSIIQFTSERNKVLAEFCQSIYRVFLFLLESEENKDNLTDTGYERAFNRIADAFDDYESVGYSSLYWFDQRIFKDYCQLTQSMLKIRMPFWREDYKATIQKLERSEIQECIKLTARITDKYYSETTNIFKHLEQFVEDDNGNCS